MKNTQKTITRTIEGKHITVARITVVDGEPKMSTDTITQIEGFPAIPADTKVISEECFTEVCSMPVSFFYHNSEHAVKREESMEEPREEPKKENE